MNISRILLALMLIVGAGSAVAAGTGAFFSDTETSTGNVFTAGALDLKVDHTLQTYNGNIVGGSLTIVSDTQPTFSGDDGAGNSVALSFIHPAWDANIPGATWIWATQGPTNPSVSQTNTFTRTFNSTGSVSSASLMIAADNHYTASVNGSPLPVVFDENNFQAGTQDVYDIAPFLVNGVNTIAITVTNLGVPGSDGGGNPAGLLFKATIEGEANTWTEKDLESGDVFWNFDDVKPGDTGTNVISLHVYDNDAYACLNVANVADNENTVVEPELPDGGPNGELAPFLKLFVWDDGASSDGVYNVGDPIIYGPNAPLSGFGTANRIELLATTTKYIGAAWCFGEQSVSGGGAISCDGSSDGYNVAQTDSVVADLEFLAVQQRNNSSFQCEMPEEQCIPSEVNVFANGGFENPEVTDGAQWDVFSGAISNWTVAWRSDIPTVFNSVNRPEPGNFELHEGVLGAAYEGNQYIELDSDWDGHAGTLDGEPASTAISQVVTTVPGDTYTVSFRFAPRPNTPAADNHVQAAWNGVALGTAGPQAGGGGNLIQGDWQLFGPYQFVATSTQTVVSFTDIGTANSLGSFIDDVIVTHAICTPVNQGGGGGPQGN